MREIVLEPVYENTARYLIEAIADNSFFTYDAKLKALMSLTEHILYLQNNNPVELRAIMEEMKGKTKGG